MKALYYPFSRCLDDNHLKRSILLFDEIWFVDALSKHSELQYGNVDLWFSRHPLALINASCSGPNYFQRTKNRNLSRQNYDELKEGYKLLLSENIINSYNPIETVNKYDEVLASAWLHDIVYLNRRVLQGSISYNMGGTGTSVSSWQTLTDRIPKSFLKALEPTDRLKLYENYPQRVINAAKASKDDLPFSDFRIKKEIDSDKGVFSKTFLEYKDDIAKQIDKVWHKEKVSYERGEEDFGALIRFFGLEGNSIARMPFDWGASLCINQALLIADLENFALITEQDVSYNLLLHKYEIASKNPNRKTERKVLLEDSARDKEKLSYVGLNVVNRLLPNHVLEELSFEDICKYRKKSKDSRDRFLAKLNEFVTLIEGDIYEEKFTKGTKSILKKIDVEAQNYNDDLKVIYEDLFGNSNIIQKVSTSIGPSLLGTLMKLSPGEVFLLACAGLGTTVGLVAPEILKYWKSKRKIRRNYLTYMMKLNK